MIRCNQCHQKIKGIPFRCRRCGRYFCAKHRLPENHHCSGLKKGNIYMNLADSGKHHKSFERVDIYTSHFFITNIFNSCFNEIIGKYLESKDIGRVKGGLHDIVMKKQHPNYWMALKLKELRENFYNKNSINKADINDFLGKINNLLEDTTYDPELQSKIKYFLHLVNKRYHLNPRIKVTNRPPPVSDEYKREVVSSLKEEKPSVSQPSKKSTIWKKLNIILKKKPVKILFLILVSAIVLLYAAFSDVTEDVSEEVMKTKTVLVNVSDKISFSGFLENIYVYDGKKVTIKGFLRRYVEGGSTTGVYVESVIDDYKNNIDLLKLSPEQKALFPHKGDTQNIYEIEGVFKRDYKTLRLEANKIKESKRDPAGQEEKTVSYMDNVTKTITRARYPVIRAFVFNIIGKEFTCEDDTILNNCSKDAPYYCTYTGLIKDPVKCGCPKDQRVYQKECIPEVKCSDGTLEPECSKNQPKQCVDGKLVDNADLCGCPEDYKKVDEGCVKILRCSDGTVYGECSNKKPYLCSGGKLVKDASICQCERGFKPIGKECIEENKAEAMETLGYINELRESYGRSELEWNDNLYELAMFRAKDMYDKKYFDHVTPDGKCVKDFKADFGLGEYTIAENAGAVMYGYDKNGVDYASYASPKGQVDGWMQSRGHRYNLLYPFHVIGVATCYKGACIFLGGNRDAYGLGVGPCTTGDQGTAYWNSVGQQPGEI